MSDLSGYVYLRFPYGTQVGDQWRCLCPSCQNEKQKFFINTDDGRSNCFHCDFHSSSWVGLIAGTEGLTGKQEIGKWIRDHESELKSPHRYASTHTSRMPMRLNLPAYCVPIEPHDPFYDYLLDRGISPELITEYQMHKCIEGKYQFRIIIPILENEKLVFFFDRTVDPGEQAKTLGIGSKEAYWPIDKSEVLFNLDVATKQVTQGQPLMIAEGIFDALSLGYNCIALLGKSCSEMQMKKILDTGAERVEVCLDDDAIGHATRLAKRLQAWGLEVFIRRFTKGDPNDYHVNNWDLPEPDLWTTWRGIQYSIGNHIVKQREAVSFL